MNLWEQVAKKWRIQITTIDQAEKEAMENQISEHIEKVQKTIETSKTVPSARDAIFADDDDDDDW